MRRLLLLLMIACPAAAQTNAFFTHFTGTSLPSGWTASASGADGVVCMNGTAITGTGTCSASGAKGPSFLEVVTTATGSTAFVYNNTKIDKTKSQLWLFAVGTNAAASSSVVTIINDASAPVAEVTNNCGKCRVRIDIDTQSATQGIRVNKWDGSHTRTQWNGSAWAAPPVTSGSNPVTFSNAYYVVGIEIDGPNAQWRVHFFGRDATGFSSYEQGSVIHEVLTDWVTWASQETNTDLWVMLGERYTDAITAPNVTFEWAYMADGAQVHAFLNGQNGGATYDIRHVWGYVGPNGAPDFFVPEDRTTVAVAAGSAGQWDDSGVKDPSVVQDGSNFYMVYWGDPGVGSKQIGCATASSVNGPWTKCTVNPILAPVASTNEDSIVNPFLVKDLAEPDANKRWKILYGGYNAAVSQTYIFVAYCADPPNTCSSWTKLGTGTPLVGPGPAAATIAASPTGVSRSGGVVTITTTAAHNLTTGAIVFVGGTAGCAESPNGAFTITVTGSTTFTYSQGSTTETCGSGTTTQFDSVGPERSRPYFMSGLWYMFNATREGGAQTGSPRRITYSVGANLTSAFTQLHQVAVNAMLTSCNSNLTANMTATRTATVASTTGCSADQFIVADQDTTANNILTNRILTVDSATQLTLYAPWDGLTTTTPAKIRGADAWTKQDPGSFYQVAPRTFWHYATCYQPYSDISGSISGTMETACLYKSTTGLLGTWTRDELWSPYAPINDFGHLRSHENMVLVGTPTPVVVSQILARRTR